MRVRHRRVAGVGEIVGGAGQRRIWVIVHILLRWKLVLSLRGQALGLSGLGWPRRTRPARRRPLAAAKQGLRHQRRSTLRINGCEHRIPVVEKSLQHFAAGTQALRCIRGIGDTPARTQTSNAVGQRRDRVADRRVGPALKAGAQAIAKIGRTCGA